MGCELNARIIYTEFTSVIRKQKEVGLPDCYNDIIKCNAA